MDKLLESEAAAALLGISKSMLNKSRVTGGGPPFIKIGSRVLYDKRDLEKYVAANRQRSTAETGR